MDGTSSDTEYETIIATTTYITLSGSHTTESEVLGSSSKEAGQNQHHQHKISFLSKQTKIENIPTKIQDALIEIKIENDKQEKHVAETSEPYTPMTTETAANENSSSPVGTSLICYQPLKENARESACCKVQTIIMDPVPHSLAETVATSPATSIIPSTQIQRSNRFTLILRRIGRRLLICIQMNRDCIFCLMFFLAFVICASFLTVFFYKAMTLNPQTFQYPVPTGRIYYL